MLCAMKVATDSPLLSCHILILTLIVKDRISMPILPTSIPATSLTSWANWSRSWYTSSTVKVAGEEQQIETNS